MSNWFNSLSSKVVAFFLVLTALSIVFLNALAFWSSSRVFRDQTLHAMQSTLTFRGDMLGDLLTQMQNQAVSIAKIESLDQSTTALKSGWKTIVKNSGDAKAELQLVFVTQNPHGPNEREKLAKPDGPSGFYYSSHEKTQGEVASYLADTAFHDLLIADQDGNVIYSYKKAPIFAENLKVGRWADTGAGRAFAMSIEKAAAATDDAVPPSFSGLRVGADAGNPDIYFSVPRVKLGGLKGVILFQLKQEAIAGLLAKGISSSSDETSAFLGGDGSGVVLGTDGRLADLAAGALPVNLPQTIGAAPEIADFETPAGPVRSYMRAVAFEDQKFVVVETIPLSELQAASISIAKVLMASGVAVLVLMAGATLLLGRRLFAPLVRLASLTGEVANGRLDGTVTSQDRNDEIGTMARSLEQFRAALVEQRNLEVRNEETRARAEHDRRQRLAERDAEARTLKVVVDTLDEGLQSLAGGDLAYRIHGEFPRELEALRLNFNKALATLSETLAGIGINSAAVREGSGEMRQSADRLAERTERQSSAISETVTAIHAVTDAVRIQIAKAESASRIASEAKQDTVASGKIMNDTIAAMEAIQSSSQKINQIIGVIDEIAFQTNLLALNAGVEAARAGESGKGFAVVAQEVRELAQRSSTAAKEISSLLERSTREVESGVGLVERAGRALDGIGSRVGEIDGQIADIMQSTREEASTLAEINRSIGGLDGMTQQNAAMVHETTAAIHKLAKEAADMDQRLAQFALGEKSVSRGSSGWRNVG